MHERHCGPASGAINEAAKRKKSPAEVPEPAASAEADADAGPSPAGEAAKRRKSVAEAPAGPEVLKEAQSGPLVPAGTSDEQVKRKRGRPRTRPEKIKKVKKKKMKRTKIGRPSKKELEERKAQESQEESEGKTEAPHVCHCIEGARPTVYFPQSSERPPATLLPPDATVRPMSEPPAAVAPATTHRQTVEAGQDEGLEAPGAWPGLGELPEGLPEDFRSLLILGPSGSGKSTLARTLLKKYFPKYSGPLYPSAEWPKGKAVIEQFDDAERGRDWLTGVGLGSVPSWVKPFEVLSTGERYRANLALALQERSKDPSMPLVLDEWTSELDRDLARCCCVAFAKRMRRDFQLQTEVRLKEKACEGPAAKAKEQQKDEEHEDVKMGKEDPEVPGVGAAEDAAEENWAGDHEGEEEEDWADDPVLEDKADAQPKTSASHVEVEPEPETKEQVQKGPYIFASCHEDVLEYLQPQYVCLCLPGSAPRLLKNPHEGQLPSLHATITGVTEPIGHHLVGSWMPKNKKIQPFLITHKASVKPNQFTVFFEGGGKIAWLGQEADGTFVGSGKIMGTTKTMRITSLSPYELSLELDKGEPVKAERRRMPASHQIHALTADPEESVKATRGCSLDYAQCRRDYLEASGWYLPDIAMGSSDSSRYKGLSLGQSHSVRTVDFRPDARLEKVDNDQRYLASYVGLGPKLANVAKLLDIPFMGLVTHRLDNLPLHGGFALGVITGPSGSGKGTLARDKFGPSPKIEWSRDPVIAHFVSLDAATDLLQAASLDLLTAMRPYETLSAGEQARADMARVLALGVNSCKVLILDEFTSLVDRATAMKMAKGLQQLINQRKLQAPIVVVSCHSDFVRKSVLEPDWIFETHNHRLFTAQVPEQPEPEIQEGKKKLEEAVENKCKAEKEMEAFKSFMLQHAGHSFFSNVYRNEVSAFVGALQVLGRQELLAREKDVLQFQHELQELQEKAATGRKEITIQAEDVLPVERPDNASSLTMGQIPWKIPVVQLVLRRALPREWVHFRQWHYKDKSLMQMSACFVGVIAGRPCVFTALVTESHNWIQRSCRKGVDGHPTCQGWNQVGYPQCFLKQSHRRLFREHRTVVLPDFQGTGVAGLVSDSLALYFQDIGMDVTSQTVHPFYGSFRDQSPFWRPLPTNRMEKSGLKGNLKYSHVFVGAYRPDGTKDEAREQQLRSRVSITMNQSAVLQDEEVPELS